jgi:hypothetical protein
MMTTILAILGVIFALEFICGLLFGKPSPQQTSIPLFSREWNHPIRRKNEKKNHYKWKTFPSYDAVHKMKRATEAIAGMIEKQNNVAPSAIQTILVIDKKLSFFRELIIYM